MAIMMLIFVIMDIMTVVVFLMTMTMVFLTLLARFLMTKFPETVAAADREGRTALHYLAALGRGGNLYREMVQVSKVIHFPFCPKLHKLYLY